MGYKTLYRRWPHLLQIKWRKRPLKFLTYKFNPFFFPKIFTTSIPILVLYFKTLRYPVYLKKNIFLNSHIDNDYKKNIFFWLVCFVCSNRVCFLFFFKLQYIWLYMFNGLFLNFSLRLFRVVILLLKLSWHKYLFKATHFKKRVEVPLPFCQLKWRVSLSNFFLLGRYIEYCRRAMYNEYLAIAHNNYSSITRTYRLPHIEQLIILIFNKYV